MNKLLPFVFPAVALLVVIFLAFRWYSLNTPDQKGSVSEFGENVNVEQLPDADQAQMLTSVDDYQTVELNGEGEVGGQIRYEVKDSKVRFSVMALLPETTGQYQVWLKKADGTELMKAFDLDAGKGGYIGSAALSESALPFEVLVIKPGTTEPKPEEALLKGTIAKP